MIKKLGVVALFFSGFIWSMEPKEESGQLVVFKGKDEKPPLTIGVNSAFTISDDEHRILSAPATLDYLKQLKSKLEQVTPFLNTPTSPVNGDYGKQSFNASIMGTDFKTEKLNLLDHEILRLEKFIHSYKDKQLIVQQKQDKVIKDDFDEYTKPNYALWGKGFVALVEDVEDYLNTKNVNLPKYQKTNIPFQSSTTDNTFNNNKAKSIPSGYSNAQKYVGISAIAVAIATALDRWYEGFPLISKQLVLRKLQSIQLNPEDISPAELELLIIATKASLSATKYQRDSYFKKQVKELDFENKPISDAVWNATADLYFWSKQKNGVAQVKKLFNRARQ